MNDRPFSVFAHPHGNRLHNASAVALSVSRLVIHVQTGKTVRTMVSVICAGISRRNKSPADLAGEAFATRMIFIIAFSNVFRLFSRFMIFPPKECKLSVHSGRNGEYFCRPPGQITLSDSKIKFFKKFSVSFVIFISKRRKSIRRALHWVYGWQYHRPYSFL